MILRELLTFVANILRFEEDDEEEKLPTICRGWCDCCCEHRIIIIIIVVFVAFPSDFFKSFARRYMHTRKAFKKEESVFCSRRYKKMLTARRETCFLSLSLSLRHFLRAWWSELYFVECVRWFLKIGKICSLGCS
jgi:hypothetical protein